MSPTDLTAQLEGIVSATAPDAIPALLGALEQAEAKAWARLTIPPQPPKRETSEKLLTPAEALAAIGGAPTRSLKWLYACTRGKPFRRNLSRKVIRFEERGLRAWLAARAANR